MRGFVGRFAHSIQLGLLLVTSACVLLATSLESARAEWPERTVKLLVTFPPGSANAAAARIFADALSKRWRKPVVVEDKPGAEGTLGVDAFVSSQDDHSLLYTVAGSITVAPLLIDKLPYDVEQDLKPVASTTEIVLTLAVANSFSTRTIPELVDALRAKPAIYAWTSGPTIPRYVFAAFLKRHDLQMIFVSYRDAAQPQADLGEGRIQVLVTSLTASSSPVQTGKARFLAVLNPTRAATLPDVKTARELGYPELEVNAGSGFFSGNAMPETIRARVAADVAAICQDPEVKSKLEASGHNVLKGTRDDLVARIANQKTWVKEISKYVDIRNAQ